MYVYRVLLLELWISGVKHPEPYTLNHKLVQGSGGVHGEVLLHSYGGPCNRSKAAKSPHVDSVQGFRASPSGCRV